MGADDRAPRVDSVDEPFWAAARAGEFRMQRCEDCAFVWWAPGPVCPRCWSDRYEWVPLTGRGTVNSWVVFHRAYWPDLEAEVPYAVAEVELEEGPRYLARVVGCNHDDLHRGMRVAVAFEHGPDDAVLPVFEPRDHD